MRSKEFAHDYRYFPEPDLLPWWSMNLGGRDPRHASRAARPRRERFAREYQLSTYDADVLTQRKDVADYFEAGVAAGAGAKEMANWVMTELLRMVREEKLDRQLVIHEWPLAPTQLARLVLLVQKGNRQPQHREGAHSEAARHDARSRGAGRRRGPRAGERPRRARGGGRGGDREERGAGRRVPAPARSACSASSSAR